MHARDIPEPTPKSAARLAAEALFDQHRPAAVAPEGPGPVVKVVSRRRVVPPAEATPAEDLADGTGPARKTPRVFVLRPAAAATGAPPEATPDAVQVPATPVRRRRLRAAPVTVIYSAPPGPSAEERAAAAAARAEAELPSSTRLATALAAVDPILADIRAAMSFDVRPRALGAEWDRLSAQADRIAQDLAAWALNPFTPPPDKAVAAVRRR